MARSRRPKKASDARLPKPGVLEDNETRLTDAARQSAEASGPDRLRDGTFARMKPVVSPEPARGDSGDTLPKPRRRMSTIDKDFPPVTLMPPVIEPEAPPRARPTREVKAFVSTRHMKERGRDYESTSFIDEVRNDVRRQHLRRMLKRIAIVFLAIFLLVPLGLAAYIIYADTTEELTK